METNIYQSTDELPNEKKEQLKNNFLLEIEKIDREYKKQMLIIKICLYAVKALLWFVMGYFFCFALYVIYSLYKIR